MKLYCSIIVLLAITFECIGQTELSDKMDRYLKPYVRTNNFSGTVLVAKNGEILFHKSYGKASIELNVSNNLNTKYHTASISKTFTAAAILILEQRGLLATDDLLSKFIPDYPMGDKITIHHLLSHTSGITNINNLPEYNDASVKHQTPESLITLFKDKPLEFHPGEKYQYSNSNYNLLAFIIEKVSGKKYGTFLSDEIFIPFKMENTLHHSEESLIISNEAEGYAPDGNFGLQKAPFLDWSSKTGNGSLVTTASDLFLWNQSFLNEKILSEESKAKIFKLYAGSGYGWYIGKKFNKDCIYMNGRSPGFSSHISQYPSEKVCVIVLENIYISTATPIGFDLAGILFNQPIYTPELKLGQVDKEDSKMITGKYKFGKDFYQPDFLMTVTEKNGNLFTDWGELVPGKPLQFIQRSYWSKISFTKDEQGKINAMTFDNFKGNKIN
jgi:CubicO group peptidase (beta-lactamase class C family)